MILLRSPSCLLQGLYQKAEALYTMGNFEFALVYYHRGNKLCPELQDFRLGIQKAQEAIDNSVGSKSSDTTWWEMWSSYFGSSKISKPTSLTSTQKVLPLWSWKIKETCLFSTSLMGWAGYFIFCVSCSHSLSLYHLPSSFTLPLLLLYVCVYFSS